MRLRSMLFAPAHREDMLRKLSGTGADAVVLDLEDGVPAAAKNEARQTVASLAGEIRGPLVFVRTNPVATSLFTSDVAALPSTIAGIVVPKVDSPQQVTEITSALAARDLAGLAVVAGIETATGVAACEQTLTAGVAAAYFGAEDFTADMNGVRTEAGLEVLYARSRVAMAARLAGVPAIDQVVTQFHDDELFARDAALGRALGYAGKMCIHPRQVPAAHDAFSPSENEVDQARRIIAAYDEAGGGAIAVDGQMIDEPLVRRARALVAAVDG